MNSSSGLMSAGGLRKKRAPAKKSVRKAKKGGDEYLFYDGDNMSDPNVYNIDTGVKKGGNIFNKLADYVKMVQGNNQEGFSSVPNAQNVAGGAGKKKAVAKRPLTEYQKFMKVTLKQLKVQHANKKQSELMKLGAKMWNQHKNK
jgi:hypothetical protein